MIAVLDFVKRAWARLRSYEPARLAAGVRGLLVAAVAVGWVTIDDARINAAVSAVAFVADLFTTSKVRASVTPVAKLGGCDIVQAHDPSREG